MSSKMWDVKTPEEIQSAVQALKNEAMGRRYVVEEGSHLGHCCIAASVIDTQSTSTRKGICECLEVADAEKIATLLNGPLPVLTELVGEGVVVK